jgi:hypothetical protein
LISSTDASIALLLTTHERLQAVRVIAAKVIGKAVVGPDKADLNLDVVRG